MSFIFNTDSIQDEIGHDKRHYVKICFGTSADINLGGFDVGKETGEHCLLHQILIKEKKKTQCTFQLGYQLFKIFVLS